MPFAWLNLLLVKFSKKLFACLLLLLPLGLLSGCSVYEAVFHPHRLGTPPMTSSAKARMKAAEKARHKGTSLKAAEAPGAAGTGDDAPGDPAAPAPADDARSLADKNKAVDEMLGNTYNTKTGLLKRSRFQRMQYSGHQLHHYDTRPLTPREASRENRQLRKKGHTDHGQDAPRRQEKAEPLDPALDTGPDPGPPAAPAPKAPPGAGKKPPLPKPAPTQPAPGH